MGGPNIQRVPYPVYLPSSAPPAIAQDEIQTEADKAAETVKTNARKATGRKATILTTPLGVLQQSSQQGGTLLGS